MSILTTPGQSDSPEKKWARRRDIPIAILAWTVLAAIVLWGASHIARSLLLLVISALFAYALAPVVKVLQRAMPRFLSILIVYIVVLGALVVLFYFIVRSAIEQTFSLFHFIRVLLRPGPHGHLTSLEETLQSIGISPEQLAAIRMQFLGRAESSATEALVLLRSILNFALDTILVAILSIYLLLDGSRAANWLRRNAPRSIHADFILDTLQRVVGGYIRGQFILAILIGTLVGVGMFLFGLPYAAFLGVLAFIMAFIPVLGTLISGTVCVLIGLTHGWLIAAGVLTYFVIVHVIESDLVGPRIVGKALGIHPVVSIFAFVAGAELFGVWGALFASPIAGAIQAFLTALWLRWRETHPEEFPPVKPQNISSEEEQPAHTVSEPITR